MWLSAVSYMSGTVEKMVWKKIFYQTRVQNGRISTCSEKLKRNEDLTRMRRANQATRMKKMFNEKTRSAEVGDLIKVRLDQRDVKTMTNMQHVIVGFAYSVTAGGGAYLVTTEGIAEKKRTGCKGGVEPIPFSPEQYVIMNEHAAIPSQMQAIRDDIMNGYFVQEEHVIRCVTGLRVDLIDNFGFIKWDKK